MISDMNDSKRFCTLYGRIEIMWKKNEIINANVYRDQILKTRSTQTEK